MGHIVILFLVQRFYLRFDKHATGLRNMSLQSCKAFLEGFQVVMPPGRAHAGGENENAAYGQNRSKPDPGEAGIAGRFA